MIAFKIKEVRIRIGYERIIQKINLESLSKSLKHIEHAASNLKTDEQFVKTLDYKLKIAYEKIAGLNPRRKKRALINALGSLIKFVAGNPDNDDLEIIKHNLENLTNQENEIVTNMAKQIVINDKIQSKVNEITEALRKLNQRILQSNDSLATIRMDVEYINLIINTDLIIQILRDIEEQIEFAKIDLINRNLWTLEEKRNIFDKLIRQGLKLNYLDEIYYYTSGSVTISEQNILVMAKIPVLDSNVFNLINVQTTSIRGLRIDTPFKLVAKSGNRILPQQQSCDICEETPPINDECIANLLNHQTANCKIIPNTQPTRVTEIQKGIVLVDTNEKVLIQDSCKNSRIIESPTVVEIENCTVKILNLTFGTQQYQSHREEYLIPIYGRLMNVTNTTSDFMTPQRLALTNLEKLEKIKIQLHHSKRTTIIVGALLLTLILICFITNHFISRKVKTSRQITPSKDTNPTVPTVTTIHEDRAITGTKSQPQPQQRSHSERAEVSKLRSINHEFLPTFALFNKSFEDKRQSQRGGVIPGAAHNPADAARVDDRRDSKLTTSPNTRLATGCFVSSRSDDVLGN